MKRALLLLIILLCFAPFVDAQTASFSQPDATAQKDVYMYAANGTLLGLYNTTSTGIPLPSDSDVIFTIKPQYTNPLDDPAGWLSSTFSYVSSNLTALLIVMFLLGYIVLGRGQNA